jgi:hypothetical protein
MGKKKKKGKKGSGVFVDESASGARPIEGVGTAVAAFNGVMPLDPVRLLTVMFVVTAAVGGATRIRARHRA